MRRSQRSQIAHEAVARVAEGVATLPQDQESEDSVERLRDLVARGKVEVRAYLRSPLHAKAYLCWYDNHAEPGAAVVGSSNLTLAGFTGNTELNVRVTGDAEMETPRKWFDDLWRDSEDISLKFSSGARSVLGHGQDSTVSRLPEGAVRTLLHRCGRRAASGAASGPPPGKLPAGRGTPRVVHD